MSILENLGITKAPWRVAKNLNNSIGVANGDRMICNVAPDWLSEKHENIANSQLIAAAPEMWEALYKIYETLHNPDKSLANLNSEINNSLKVIQKATGKSWEEIRDMINE